MKIAIVGAGPAGFYLAERLLRRSPSLQLSMFEKHWSPFGFIRYGVAPDHPELRV